MSDFCVDCKKELNITGDNVGMVTSKGFYFKIYPQFSYTTPKLTP